MIEGKSCTNKDFPFNQLFFFPLRSELGCHGSFARLESGEVLLEHFRF